MTPSQFVLGVTKSSRAPETDSSRRILVPVTKNRNPVYSTGAGIPGHGQRLDSITIFDLVKRNYSINGWVKGLLVKLLSGVIKVKFYKSSIHSSA